jgi:putative glutamine amidotransferase
MTALPRIAIPEPTSTDEAYNQRSLPQYLRAIEAAGGIGVPIPLHATSIAQADMLASCAGILLPGSPADIDPARYAQEAIKECAGKDPEREAADDLLLGDAFLQGKPILGVCYGLQSLNVWRRGSLIQDLPLVAVRAHVASPMNHAPGSEVQRAHPIQVSAGSRLAEVWTEQLQEKDRQELYVNSSHHQAVDAPGENLKVAATSPTDGVIEALEGSDPLQFVIAVQWHPERSYAESAASRALFASFIAAAQVWQADAREKALPGVDVR